MRFCMDLETQVAVDINNDQTEYFDTKGRKYLFPNYTDLCFVTYLEYLIYIATSNNSCFYLIGWVFDHPQDGVKSPA